MTDLVQQLREEGLGFGIGPALLCYQAAEEIERLREALEDMINLAEAANAMDDPAYDAARKALGETDG